MYSGQGEAGGLGERPNESDNNNFIGEESNMRNYKNTIVRRLSCVRDAADRCGSCSASPSRAEGGQGTEAGLPGWLEPPANSPRDANGYNKPSEPTQKKLRINDHLHVDTGHLGEEKSLTLQRILRFI